jgi:hypothetical protein
MRAELARRSGQSKTSQTRNGLIVLLLVTGDNNAKARSPMLETESCRRCPTGNDS